MGFTRKTVKICSFGLAPIHYRDKEERQIKVAERSLDVQRKMYKEQLAGDGDRLNGTVAQTDDPMEQLERLARLHDGDVLTDEEFEAQKDQILARNRRRGLRDWRR